MLSGVGLTCEPLLTQLDRTVNSRGHHVVLEQHDQCCTGECPVMAEPVGSIAVLAKGRKSALSGRYSGGRRMGRICPIPAFRQYRQDWLSWVQAAIRSPAIDWPRCAASSILMDAPATSKLDDFWSSHSMTSSARPSIKGGTVKPSAFAVLRLMTKSNLVGC